MFRVDVTDKSTISRKFETSLWDGIYLFYHIKPKFRTKYDPTENIFLVWFCGPWIQRSIDAHFSGIFL